MTDEEREQKDWVERDSETYADLKAIVMSSDLTRDLQQMYLFKHTGNSQDPFTCGVFGVYKTTKRELDAFLALLNILSVSALNFNCILFRQFINHFHHLLTVLPCN